jgi:hypothetical protein
MNFAQYLDPCLTIHQNIMDVYISKKTVIEKWSEISTIMYSNTLQMRALFFALKKETRKDIKLDYKIDLKQLQKQISSEANLIVKSSLIITSLHHVIYGLMSQEGNYYIMLNGRDEIKVLKDDVKYYINVSFKNEQNIFFQAFILQYALESLFNKHFYIGIDFEYTNKKIQLAQLNFEHNFALESFIMIVSPNELEKIMFDTFVDLIICNKYIKKILHGSDSLDIPYIWEHMLENNHVKIIKFNRTMIDTRFLCEYYKLNKNVPSDNKCSIYSDDKTTSTIYFFGVISDEQQEIIKQMLDDMPPVHDITWNVHKMEKSKIYYAFRDVIYLKYFYYRMIYTATQEEESMNGKKIIMKLYQHVLFEFTQFMYLESRGLSLMTTKCKEEVDPINNYMIRKPDHIYKLVDIYNKISTDIKISDPKVEIDKITKVTYYKSRINLMIKKMTYTILTRRCKIYKDKQNLYTDKLDNSYIFDFLEEMNFHYLNKIFKEVEKVLESRIKPYC